MPSEMLDQVPTPAHRPCRSLSNLSEEASRMYSNLEVITLPFVQHTRAACWFYRFLSIVYGTYINLLFWTERMRTHALTLTRLDEPNLQIIDVGAGTGFTTQWIVQFVNSRQITCVDQRSASAEESESQARLERLHIRPLGWGADSL